MASGSKNHIWPAYVDMMTVLLMVYMLLSMIFQVLAALATPSDGPPTPTDTSRPQASISTHPAEVDDTVTQQPNDFVASVSHDENFLQPATRASVREWMSRNAQAIRERGLLAFSLTGSDDAPLGVRLRMQYERSLSVVSIADELKIPRDKIELRNPVKIRPEDRDKIWQGMPARVHVNAFGNSYTDTLNGRVAIVSADALGDDKSGRFYEVTVEVPKSNLKKPIYPGMAVESYLLAGHRSLAQYLLKPLMTGASAALSES